MADTRPLARAARVDAEPLLIGLTDDQHALLTVLRDQTTPEARILWDEIAENRPGWNWSALLPMLTGRDFLGGLDPDSGVEHSYCALCSRQLTGRMLADWSDGDLEVFCRWYNVGWVVARSPAGARALGPLPARSLWRASWRAAYLSLSTRLTARAHSYWAAARSGNRPMPVE